MVALPTQIECLVLSKFRSKHTNESSATPKDIMEKMSLGVVLHRSFSSLFYFSLNNSLFQIWPLCLHLKPYKKHGIISL